MKLTGQCTCGKSIVEANFTNLPNQLSPRICDCEYCETYPSAVLSSPQMTITVKSPSIREATNGSGQASFYHCSSCDQLLAVGAELDKRSLGAVNAFVLGGISQFAEPVSIKPRLLSADEKAARWKKLWGKLRVEHG